MEIENYQRELRHAYVRGGPGAIISGVVWLIAALVASSSSISTGFTVLFFGGMLIFPISKLAVKLLFRRDSESKSNPGGLVVIETVFPMIGGLFAAWLLLPHRPEFVFSIAAIAVGAHYFGFRTAYGDWTYWVFGALLCAVGVASVVAGLPPSTTVPFLVAGIEIAFGIGLIWLDRTADGNETGSNA